MRIIHSLVSTVRVLMSSRQKQAMLRLDAEDCRGIILLTQKEQKKQGNRLTDEYCERACIALKQYYALSIFDSRNMHAISELLDPFWHAHILDTMRYGMLCNAIGGFMHHDPLDHCDEAKVSAVVRVYTYSYNVLGRIFGVDNLDPDFHPKTPSRASMVCRHDLETQNVYDDVFPEFSDLRHLRDLYGYEAQRSMIGLELASIR